MPQDAAIRQGLGLGGAGQPAGADLRQLHAEVTVPGLQGQRRLLDRSHEGGAVLGMDHGEQRPAILAHGLGFEAEQGPDALAAVGEAGAPIREEPELVDHARQAPGELAEPLVALLQPGLGLPDAGDVGQHDATQAAIGGERRLHQQAQGRGAGPRHATLEGLQGFTQEDLLQVGRKGGLVRIGEKVRKASGHEPDPLLASGVSDKA